MVPKGDFVSWECTHLETKHVQSSIELWAHEPSGDSIGMTDQTNATANYQLKRRVTCPKFLPVWNLRKKTTALHRSGCSSCQNTTDYLLESHWVNISHIYTLHTLYEPRKACGTVHHEKSTAGAARVPALAFLEGFTSPNESCHSFTLYIYILYICVYIYTHIYIYIHISYHIISYHIIYCIKLHYM